MFFFMTGTLALAEGMRDFYLRSHRLMDRLMKAQGASFARMRLLYFVHKSGTARSVDIGEALGYAPRTVTMAVDALERDGLVQRVTDSSDRRVKHISVTDAGAKLVREVEPAKEIFIEQAFGILDQAESETLHRLMTKLNARLDQMIAEGEN